MTAQQLLAAVKAQTQAGRYAFLQRAAGVKLIRQMAAK